MKKVLAILTLSGLIITGALVSTNKEVPTKGEVVATAVTIQPMSDPGGGV